MWIWDICEQLLIMFGCSKLQVWGNENSLGAQGTWLFGGHRQVMDMCYPCSPSGLQHWATVYGIPPEASSGIQILVFQSGDHSDNTPLFGLSLLLYLPSHPLLIPGIMSLSKVLPIKLPLSLQCPLTFSPFYFRSAFWKELKAQPLALIKNIFSPSWLHLQSTSFQNNNILISMSEFNFDSVFELHVTRIVQ